MASHRVLDTAILLCSAVRLVKAFRELRAEQSIAEQSRDRGQTTGGGRVCGCMRVGAGTEEAGTGRDGEYDCSSSSEALLAVKQFLLAVKAWPQL